MKKETSALSIMINHELTPEENNKEGMQIILNFMRMSKLKIRQLAVFSKAAEKKPSLIKKLEDVMEEAERSSY